MNGRLTPGAIARVDAAGPCVVGVSGGRDSMLLCYLLYALRQAGHLQHTPRVFHLDHGLRADSSMDREFVAAAARALDLPFSSTARNVAAFARRTRGGLEAAGRTLRYRQMERLRQWAGGSWIVTGHHADDYVESLLAHLIRGGGPAALRTLEAFSVNDGVPLWRPLLCWDRAQIDALVSELDIAFREDPTNAPPESAADPDAESPFLRNRLRASVLPRLRREGLDAAKLWRNFHDAPGDVPEPVSHQPAEPTDAARRAVPANARPEYLAIDRRLLPTGPAPLREWKAVMDLAFARLGCPPAERDLLSAVQRQLSAAAPAGQHGGGRARFENRRVVLHADRRGALWIFRRDAAVLRSAARVVDLAADINAAGAAGQALRSVRLVWNGRERDYQLGPGEAVGQWRPGLKALAADGHRLAVNQLLREAAVPEPVRSQLPLILAADGSVRTLCLAFWEQLRDRHFPRA